MLPITGSIIAGDAGLVMGASSYPANLQYQRVSLSTPGGSSRMAAGDRDAPDRAGTPFRRGAMKTVKVTRSQYRVLLALSRRDINTIRKRPSIF
jgi:hypothetical protein